MVKRGKGTPPPPPPCAAAEAAAAAAVGDTPGLFVALGRAKLLALGAEDNPGGTAPPPPTPALPPPPYEEEEEVTRVGRANGVSPATRRDAMGLCGTAANAGVLAAVLAADTATDKDGVTDKGATGTAEAAMAAWIAMALFSSIVAWGGTVVAKVVAPGDAEAEAELRWRAWGCNSPGRSKVDVSDPRRGRNVRPAPAPPPTGWKEVSVKMRLTSGTKAVGLTRTAGVLLAEEDRPTPRGVRLPATGVPQVLEPAPPPPPTTSVREGSDAEEAEEDELLVGTPELTAPAPQAFSLPRPGEREAARCGGGEVLLAQKLPTLLIGVSALPEEPERTCVCAWWEWAPTTATAATAAAAAATAAVAVLAPAPVAEAAVAAAAAAAAARSRSRRSRLPREGLLADLAAAAAAAAAWYRAAAAAAVRAGGGVRGWCERFRREVPPRDAGGDECDPGRSTALTCRDDRAALLVSALWFSPHAPKDLPLPMQAAAAAVSSSAVGQESKASLQAEPMAPSPW